MKLNYKMNIFKDKEKSLLEVFLHSDVYKLLVCKFSFKALNEYGWRAVCKPFRSLYCLNALEQQFLTNSLSSTF